MSDELPVVVLVASAFQVRGSSAYTQRLAHRLPEHGFRPLIVCPNSQRVPAALRQQVEFRDYSFLDAPVVGRLVARLAARDIARRKPVLVHIQSRRAVDAGQAIARSLRVPTLLTVHDIMDPREQLHLDPALTRSVIAVSEPVRAALDRVAGRRLPGVEMIHSGVEIPIDGLDLEILAPGRVPVIGTAGPLEHSKGIEYFLHAAHEVIARGHEVEFVVAGTGPDETRLRDLSRRLEIAKHVTFVTNLVDFGASLRAMDIFCLPSLVQGLGTIMFEAMALARPVIATEVGGVALIVRDGETGLAVPPADSARLAERMMELLSNPLRARSIGLAGRETVIRDFNAERMVQQTVQVYQRVLGAKSDAA